MRNVFVLLVAAAGVAIAPQVLAAEDAKAPPGRPNPEVLFGRLDANDDGQVTIDEVPAGAPERLKEMLKRADADGDKKVTKEELQAAFQKVQERRPGPGERPAMPPRRPDLKGPGRPDGPGGPPPDVERFARPGGPGGPMAPGRPMPKLPDPKVLFKRLDKDKDQKLSLEEFAAGLKAFHAMMVSHRGGEGPWAQGPGRGPAPDQRQADRWRPPHLAGPDAFRPGPMGPHGDWPQMKRPDGRGERAGHRDVDRKGPEHKSPAHKKAHKGDKKPHEKDKAAKAEESEAKE